MSRVARERENRLTNQNRLIFASGPLGFCACNFQVTHAPHANVRVHVPRVIVAIEGTGPTVNPVVPIAARNQGVQRKG